MQASRIGRTALSVMVAMICLGATGQEISLKVGESVKIAAVYWINNCQSRLSGFGGIDLIDGPPGIELTIREQPVFARLQNCPNKVPGGVVVLTAKEIPTKFSGTIKYRVRYNTYDGNQQSIFSKKIALDPD